MEDPSMFLHVRERKTPSSYIIGYDFDKKNYVLEIGK
jgi:hypothetical protein